MVKISFMAAVSENGIIGDGPNIPWTAKGEQLLFKAITHNQWLLVGRKTFESMGVLANRKYAVVSRGNRIAESENVLVFSSIESALEELGQRTEHLIVAGGGEIFKAMITEADTLHLSIIHTQATGDVYFPEVPVNYRMVFEQFFESNINYTYQIWQKE